MSCKWKQNIIVSTTQYLGDYFDINNSTFALLPENCRFLFFELLFLIMIRVTQGEKWSCPPPP